MENLKEKKDVKHKITFLMLVTNYDAIIADFAIKSYQKLYDKYFDVLPFRLEIYANRFSEENMKEYFPKWEKYPYVVIKNNWEIEEADEDLKTTDNYQEKIKLKKSAPEICGVVWARELQKADTPYWASVDADFEILDTDFVLKMIEEMDKNEKLVCMSSDYHAYTPNVYEFFAKTYKNMAERWDTWFCIYKNEAKQCKVPHLFYEIEGENGLKTIWDEMGYFQKHLKDDFGYELKVVNKKYQPSYMHYIAFSKNKSINKDNVALYRELAIQERHGIRFRSGIRFIDKLVNKPFRKAAKKKLDKMFPAVLEERYTVND